MKNKLNMKKKKKKVFPIIVGQCSPSLHSQLEGGKGFEKICKENDVVELLKLIWGLSYSHDQNNDKTNAILNSLRALFVNYQKKQYENDDYLKKFQACISTLDDLIANILSNIPCLLEEEVKKIFSKGLEIASKVEVMAAKKSLEQKTTGGLLLIGMDRERYGDMKSNMQLMAMEMNNYPNSLEEAMNIMNTFQ